MEQAMNMTDSRFASKSRPRWQAALGATLGLGLIANGAAMLTQPSQWYHALPTVSLTGPLNMHFVRDIGCAYALAGMGLIWGTRRGNRPAHPAAAMGALFLLMHAAVHLYETAMGLCGWATWWRDVPTVSLPALAAAWHTWFTPRAPSKERA